MPNYVKARITVRGRRELIDQLVEQVKSTYKDEEGEEHEILLDFNKITPMPESLNITDGSDGEMGMRYLILQSKSDFGKTDDDFKLIANVDKIKELDPKRFDEIIDLGKKYLHNIAEYGYPTWYRWRIENWGTKWDACEIESDGNGTFEFETAWSFPYPVIEKLSSMYPELEIDFMYADEDCGCNTGCGTLKGGDEIDGEYPDSCSDRAYELYKECWQYEDFYKDPDGEWRWHDRVDVDEELEDPEDPIEGNADPIIDVFVDE